MPRSILTTYPRKRLSVEPFGRLRQAPTLSAAMASGGREWEGKHAAETKGVIHVYSLEISPTEWDGCQQAFWKMGVGCDVVGCHDEFWIKGGYSAYSEAVLDHHCDL